MTAIAIERSNLLTNLPTQSVIEPGLAKERLAALVDLCHRLGTERDQAPLLRDFCHSLRDTIGTQCAIVVIGDGQRFPHVFASGMDAETAERIVSPDPSKGILGESISRGIGGRGQYSTGEPVETKFPDAFPPVRTWLIAPVRSLSQIIGWICLINKNGFAAFQDEDERLASMLGALAGRICESCSLHEEQALQRQLLPQKSVERRQVEAAEKARERLFRSAFEHTNVAMVLTDLHHRFVRVNAAFARLFGYSEAEMLGMSMPDITHPQDLAESYACRETLLAGETHFIQQKRYLHRNGHVLWGLTNVSLVRDSDGQPLLYVGQVQDVTEQKRAEEELGRTSELLQAVADETTDAVFVKDLLGRYLFFNQAAAQFVGRPIAEVIGKDDTHLFEPESARRVMEIDRHIMESAERKTTTEVLTAAGITRAYQATKAPYQDAKGNVVGLIGISRDITERKRVEVALQESEKLYRQLFEANPHPMWVYDTETLRFLAVNDAAVARYGYARDEFLRLTIAAIRPPEDIPTLMDAIALPIPELQRGHEWRHRWKNGTIRDVDVSSHSLLYGDRPARLVLSIDITERKRGEQRQKAQHAVVSILSEATSLNDAAPRMLRAICETTGWVAGELWVVDKETNVLTCVDLWQVESQTNADFRDQSRRMLFSPGVGLPGRVWSTGQPVWIVDILDDPNFPRAESAARAGLRGGFGFPIQFRHEILGVIAFFSQESRQPDEEMLHMFASLGSQIGQFIERKRVKGGLRLFRALIDQTTDGIEVIDPDTGRFLDVNERTCLSHGYTRDEYLGLSVCDVDPLVGTRSWREVIAERRLEGGKIFESHHQRKDGSSFPVEVNLNFVHLDREYLVAVIRDISERKRSEAALRESEERLKLALSASRMGVWEYDVRTNRVFTSPECDEIVGVQCSDWKLDSFTELLYAEDLRRVMDECTTALTSRTPFRTEFRIVRPGGEVRWVANSGRAEFDSQGCPTRLIGTLQDITDRKHAEVELRREREFIRMVLDTDPNLIFVKDSSGRFILANKALARLYDTTPEDLLGREPAVDLASPKEISEYRQVEREVLQTGRPIAVDETNTRPDGRVYWFHTVKAPLVLPDGTTHILGIAADITERKEAEKDIRERKELLRTVLNSVPCAVFRKDRNCVYLGCNLQFALDLGFADPELVVGMTDLDFARDPTEAAFSQECDRRVLKTGEPLLHVEETQTRPDGAKGVLLTSRVPLWNSTGEVIGVLGVYQDITDHKRSEAALRTAQRRLHHVVTSSPAVLFTLATDGNQMQGISWISDNLQELLGYPPSAASDPNWWKGNIHPDDRDAVIAQTHSHLFREGYATHEYRFRHQNGRYRWTRGDIRLIRDENGRAVEAVGSWSDITERRQLEEQFRQSQKMEAVGKLAGGIAHDFNNLLTVINGYSEVLIAELRPRDPLRVSLEEIRKAGERAAGLTHQLLAFSRKAVLAPVVLDMNTLLANLERMLSRLIGEDIIFNVVAEPGIWKVKVDPGQMEQVVMNLVVNARDAMPQGGKLTIETANVELNVSRVSSQPNAQSGQFVRVAVKDTGHGMDEATLVRIFEPFFTTKGPERGTGLGLATVYGIVTQSGGWVDVSSELGIGTTFKVYLPRTEDETVKKPAPSSMTTSRGSETVLLVEDEAGVRLLAKLIMERSGYKVLEARNGGEALLLCRQFVGTIHVMLSDVVMPNMSGWQLAKQLATERPDMKVLYMSGYTDDEIFRRGLVDPDTPFLQKPFTSLSLVSKIREVLGS